MRGVTVCWLLSLALGTPAVAQDTTTAGPQARPEDVASVEAILAATYDVISGPAGTRDWDRFRSLFAPGARLIPVGCDSTRTTCRSRPRTPEEFARDAGEYFKTNPFYEREAHRVVERYGHIAHAFSTYESRRAPDAEPFVRGINSFQLFHDGKRWWVVNIFWNDEGAAGPIPAHYLPKR
ncbi:MAG: hypothetical protein ACREMH_06935 [Gemmatimonadales bacterium]